MSGNPPPVPLPRRTGTSTSSSSTPATPDAPAEGGWKAKMKSKGTVWGKKAMDKGVVWSDNIGTRVNDFAETRLGTGAFWPVTGDFIKEMDKCARIIRSFTVDGIVKEETVTDGKLKTKRKVLRKIPPEVFKQAKGVAVFTAMRTGFAPLGGAGGTGMVIAKLPDGTWSAPSSITPNNLSGGFLIGADIYDCILVIRSQAAMDSFKTHKFTLGAEIGVAAGPWGAGAGIDAGKERSPVFSYINSKGLYAGVEVVGQVFVERFEENATQYHWPGVKAGDILTGKVRVPPEAANLHAALRAAETGQAQTAHGGLDVLIDSTNPSRRGSDQNLELSEGEILKLPPTPDQTDGTEHQSDPETEKVKRTDYPLLPPRNTGVLAPPPRHHSTDKRTTPSISTPVRVPGTTGTGEPVGAPMLAPDMPARPVFSHQSSSMSHYSNEDESTSTAPPPGYEATPGLSGSTYPIEKGGVIASRDTTGMTETEKREWEEHWKNEDEGR